MREPYEVLGVDRKASATDIKSAYRRLAKKLHPDANKNDPKAATRFAELNAAHEILEDEDKRKALDRGESDAEGKRRFQGFQGSGGGGANPGAGFGADANFESFSFGPEGVTRTNRRGRGGAKGGGGGSGFGGFEDILREAFGGGGGGRGARANFEPEDFGVGADVQAEMSVALTDAATGATQRLRLPNGKDGDVKIPVGIMNGQHIRLKGQGMAGPARPRDPLLTLALAPHPIFTLDGAHVRLPPPRPPFPAALGAQVRGPPPHTPRQHTVAPPA